MTREHKLALILSFAAVLVVGVLLSDHFSKARAAKLSPELANSPGTGITLPGDGGKMDRPEGERDWPVKTGMNGQGNGGLIPRGQLPPVTGKVELDPEGKVIVGSIDGGNSSPDDPLPGPGSKVSTGVEKSHTIVSGDSLYKLALTYYKDGRAAAALGQYNKDKINPAGTNMKLGVVLRIPPRDVLDGKAVLAPLPTPGKPETKPDAKPETKPDNGADGRAGSKPDAKATKTYTVASGDTLGKIAKAVLGDERRWEEIATMNPDANPTNLKVGTPLKVPAK